MANIKILVIDYEPRGIKQLRDPLVKAGFSVHVAQDGISGIQAFEKLKPDLTLVEAMLPKKHGFEVCQELKKTAHGAKSAVVIVTSVYRGRKYRTQALHNYHCDEYLEKPVSEETLLSTVNRFVKVPPRSHAVEESVMDEEPAIVVSAHDEAEAEITQRLEEILPGESPTPGHKSPKASALAENVVTFDPGRSRRRRTETMSASPAFTGVARTGTRGSAEPASVAALHEYATSAPAPDGLTELDEVPRPVLRVGTVRAGWLWGIALIVVLAASTALFFLLWPR